MYTLKSRNIPNFFKSETAETWKIYCKRGYFRWGKISRKCWLDISCWGNFHDTTHISFIKAYGFYFCKDDQSAKNAKITPTWKFPRLQYLSLFCELIDAIIHNFCSKSTKVWKSNFIFMHVSIKIENDRSICRENYHKSSTNFHTVKHLLFAWPYFRETIAQYLFTRLYFRDSSYLLL